MLTSCKKEFSRNLFSNSSSRQPKTYSYIVSKHAWELKQLKIKVAYLNVNFEENI